MHHLLDFSESNPTPLESIFHKILNGKAILFLGAGASVTDEKKFLSKDIMELYQDKIKKDIETDDITEFIDILSAKENFSRDDFDTFVYELINKLEHTKTHEIISNLPWRKIITTNFDLMLERASDKIRNNSDYEIIPIRNQQETQRTTLNNQIEYIKLNGCVKDRKKYNLIFSTDDFERVSSFYKIIINDLKQVSDEIVFISVGYSFSDKYSKFLLQKFDSYDYRKSRILYIVDPFIDENKLAYLTDKNICIIRLTASEFFTKLNSWQEKNDELIVKSKRIKIYDNDLSPLHIPHKYLKKLDNTISQLNKNAKHKYIDAKDYYLGEDPDYGVIIKNYDVVRHELLKNSIIKINAFLDNSNSNLTPIVFIKGNFGIGKSTFTYRLFRYIEETRKGILIFEVTNPFEIDINSIVELINYSNENDFFFYFNYVDRDSVFNSLLDFRNKLSKQQFNSNKIVIFASIRENMLERFKVGKDFKVIEEISIDIKLTDNEINDLIDKLKSVGLISYRDKGQKNLIFRKIKKEFKADSYVALLDLVEGNHFKDLIDAFNNLPEDAQKALLYTALTHQFNIMMPVGVLKGLISKDWDDFRKNVINIDCKGILIQEDVDPYGSSVDVYFRTKHSIIARTLVEFLIPNINDQFKFYRNIFAKVSVNKSNSRFVNDLMKNIKNINSFSQDMINKLYDLVYNELSEDPYFLLNYSINLQQRSTQKSLEKALELIIYAQSLFDYNNHRFIHRRATIYFELAKFYFKVEGDNLIFTKKYLREAEEFFELKKLHDPCSSYSYYNYIQMLLWKLDKIKFTENEILRIHIQIEELFDLSTRTVLEDYHRILELKNIYTKEYKHGENKEEYLEILNKYYEDEKSRPFAIILQYNFFEEIDEYQRCERLIEELQLYLHVVEVKKFLFKYYGRNLHKSKNRMKYFELFHSTEELENYDSLRYNYFSYVANYYNRYPERASQYIEKIIRFYDTLHPDFRLPWREEDCSVKSFKGILIHDKRNHIRVKLIDLQNNFRINNYKGLSLIEGENVVVNLYFYFYGIKAEVIEIIK